MKRVLHHTPPWAVVPASVLGATLLLVLANYALDPGTPPVAKQPPAAALDAPSPRLLPGMESEITGSAKVSGITTREGADLRHCLVSSDAVSVMVPADSSGRINTEWHPMDNSAAIPTRPVALVPTDGYVSQARMVAPLPRYGANVSDLEEMPLVAPVEEKIPEPVESIPQGMINSLFAPPALETSPTFEPRTFDEDTPVETAKETWEPLPLPLEPLPLEEAGNELSQTPKRPERLLPLPPVESSLADQTKPLPLEDSHTPENQPPKTIKDVLLPLPPVELGQAEQPEQPRTPPKDSTLITGSDEPLPLPPVDSGLSVPGKDFPAKNNALAAESAQINGKTALQPLPPVESSSTDEIVAPLIGNPSGSDLDIADLPMPLPPVESEFDENIAAEDAEVLAALPPVEPTLFTPGESLALKMIEGIFEPVEKAPQDEPRSLAVAADLKDKAQLSNERLDAAEEDEALLAATDEQPLPLPPVEDNGQVHLSHGSQTTAPQQYERSWELELIAREADKHSHRAFGLANRKALFAARREFTRALRIIAQGLDTQLNTNRHSEALAAGLRALNEAEDFLPRDGHLEAELDLAVIAGAHRTPILSECEPDEMTPLAAIQKYHTFAQEKLAEAVGREMAGSMALCGLGKLHIAISDQQRGDGIAAARPKAMVLLQAALIVSPANHMASNELGVLLAKSGRHGDARRAFEHSVAAHPTAQAWRNLALTCEQLGQMDVAYQAAQQAIAMREKSKARVSLNSPGVGSIRWVSPPEMAKTGGNLHTASASTRTDLTR